jgi:hypothetical protein
MQGGGDVLLGPYTYRVRGQLTIPSNVRVKGSRYRTIITKAMSHEDGEYGPVVEISGEGAIEDCTIEMTNEPGWEFVAFTLVDTSTSKSYNTGSDSKTNCVILLTGDHAKVANCTINPNGCVGIRVRRNRCIITGNKFGLGGTTGVTYTNAGIFIEDTWSTNVVLGNSSAAGALVEFSFKEPNLFGGPTGAPAILSSNYATITERT